MKVFKSKLIQKAIKLYGYEEPLMSCDKDFLDGYNFFSRKENIKNYTFLIWTSLTGIPECTHARAAKLLYEDDSDCWKYFERTALFQTKSHINDPFIDHIKSEFECALYVQRRDLIDSLFEKSVEYLNRDDYKTNREYIRQKVYPSTQLVHFLIEKWLGYNPVKNRILQFGEGYGIYQKLIDNWKDFSAIDSSYWNQLCDYHLSSIGLQRAEKREYEEFLSFGLIPIELINMIMVRKKLGLDIPSIKHELFETPMGKMPIIPTGYNEEMDVKYQLVARTVENKKTYTIDEIVEQLKLEHGDSVELLY